MSSYSTSSVTAPCSESGRSGGVSSSGDENKNTLTNNSCTVAPLSSSPSSTASSAPPKRTSSPFRLRSPGTQLGEGAPAYKSSPPVFGGDAAGVSRRQSVPQDGQQMLPNNSSSSSSSSFKLLKQPLLDNPLSSRPAKPMSASSTPRHSSMTSRASDSEAAVKAKANSSGSGNGAALHGTQPHVMAPLKVQASLNEREELRKKLESSDSSSSDFRSKNARKISQKYHLQGAASVAERMVAFDPDSANKLRLRSPSPSTLEGTSSGAGESQNLSLRHTDSKLNSSFLRNIPLTIATSGPDAEPIIDGDPIASQRSTARLLMHTSPVPYKRPSDSGTIFDSNQPDLPNRSATTVEAPALSSSDSRVSHRTNSLSVFENSRTEPSETCFLVRGASDASTHLIPTTVPATLRSTQLRRKFFNQTSEDEKKDTGPRFDNLLSASSLSSASGSNASFAELSSTAAGGLDEDAIVPSIALAHANAPTLDLRPFASPSAPNTIGRKKNMGLHMKEFSENQQAGISQPPSKPSSSSTASLFAKPFGTLLRKKKAGSTTADSRSQSVKEHTLSKRKDTSPARVSLSTNFTNDFIESLVMRNETEKLPSVNDSYEQMKMLEYLIRHCELTTMKSMVPCRKSVANRIDMNVMLVSNSINEMNAIYGTGNHLGASSPTKPLKPPRNEALTMGLSYHQPNTVVNSETMLGRKKSSNSPVQAEDYIESTKPPPKPLRTALSAPSASLLHSDCSNECDLRTLDPKVFTHKYPPSTSGNSSKSKFFRASNLYSTLPKFSRRTKYSNSTKNPSKMRGLDECMSVPPIIHDVSEKGGDAMVLVDPRLLQARRLNPGQQRPVTKGRPGLEQIATSRTGDFDSETDSMDDTVDVELTADYPDVGNLNKKSQSVDNVRDMMSSLESLECANYQRSVYSESNTVVVSSNVISGAKNNQSEGGSDGLVTSSTVTTNPNDHIVNDDQSDSRQDSSAKKVQKATSVGRSTSCREQKPGTPNEKRELVRLKKKMKHLHRSLDNVLEITSGQKFTPSHSCNLSEDNSRQPHTSNKATSLMKSAASAGIARTRRMASRKSAAASQLVTGHGTSGGAENGRLSCIGSDSFNFDEQSLASSTLSSSLERITFPMDERVRDKIYSVFGGAKSLEDLNCDSANETSSEGLEKIDHMDFIQVPTGIAGSPYDETDAVSGSGAGGSFSYPVIRAKTTISSTRSDMPDPYGERHRSTVTGTAMSSREEGAAIGDSALSLNQERCKENTQLFIVALHVGLKHKQIKGGGDEYVPVVITSYPHKDVIDAKECPFFQHVPSFCFPDVGSGPDSVAPKRNELDETYSFMFTDDKGGQVFAYCRRIWPDESSSANKGNISPDAANGGSRQPKKFSVYSEHLPTVYCIISLQRCFDLFDSICCELKLVKKQCHIFTVLQSLYECPVPAPGESIQVKYPFYIEHEKLKPGQHSLSIRRERKDATYEHVNLQCLPLYMDAKSLVLVFASLVLERKVWLWSSKLSVLSSCGMALHALIYPLTWEHVFVPMTSLELGIEIAKCPSPFLIGTLVPSSAKARPDVTSSCEYEDVVIVDLDNRGAFVKCVGDERKLLPERHFNALKKLIFDRKSLQKSPIVDIATTTVTPEYISESFLHFFVQALYQIDNYISFDPTNPTTPSVFNKEKYIQARSKEMRPFLTAFTSTILFSRFLERRKPLEPSRFNTRLKDYHNYREVTARTKRTGPKIFFRLSRTSRKPSINYPNFNTDQLTQSNAQ